MAVRFEPCLAYDHWVAHTAQVSDEVANSIVGRHCTVEWSGLERKSHFNSHTPIHRHRSCGLAIIVPSL